MQYIMYKFYYQPYYNKNKYIGWQPTFAGRSTELSNITNNENINQDEWNISPNNNQGEDITPEQNGWFQYADNCIAAEICPECGSEIFVNAGDIDKELGILTTLIECSTCEWKNYDYAEHRQ